MSRKNGFSKSLWLLGLILVSASIIIGYVGFSHVIGEGDAGPSSGPATSKTAAEFEDYSLLAVVLGIVGAILVQGSLGRFPTFRV